MKLQWMVQVSRNLFSIELSKYPQSWLLLNESQSGSWSNEKSWVDDIKHKDISKSSQMCKTKMYIPLKGEKGQITSARAIFNQPK